MGEVKASDPAAAAVAAANSVMPVSSVTMCEESEDVQRVHRAEASACPESAAVDSAPPSSSSSLLGGTPSLLAGDSEDSLSVVTEVDYSFSSPDSGHGTSQDGQSEETCLQVNAAAAQAEPIHSQDSCSDASAPVSHIGAEYPWINCVGPHASVMEPVAINPDTGFTTVLVDASAVAGYPHAPPGPWPPGSYTIPSPHIHPPPHFLTHSHAFVGAEMVPSDYSYMTTGYESVHAPHYEAVSPIYHDPSIHHQHLTAANATHVYSGQKGLNGRSSHRNSRGSSVSPKRPNNRSASQNNGSTVPQSHRRGAATATVSGSTGGRYTPSPSSGGGSRGSSPGQSAQQQAPPPPPTSTIAAALPHCPTGPPGGQHVVHLHVNPGETVSLQMGGQVQVIQGPATVRMVSTGSPPVPLPVQVPPGHVLQQIVDERGTLRHVILSPAPAPAQPAATSPSSGPPPNAPMGVLPLATPPHPPPPPHFHGSSHNHNVVGQPPPPPPPHFYGPNHQGGFVGPQGGYPAQYGGGPSMPPNLMGHAHPHAHGHPPSFSISAAPNRGNGSSSSPPPTVNFTNERTQRQVAKLRKKLENRSKGNPGNNSTLSPSTPPTSPKKDNNNVQKLKDRNQNGISSSSEVLGNGEDDDIVAGTPDQESESVAERIGELKLPQVNEITARSATVSWQPVETVIGEANESKGPCKDVDISYEIAIGEEGKETKVTHRCDSKECSFTVSDLQPGTDYWIRLSALADQVKVRETPAVDFRTEACPPDAPLPPKVQNRTRNSIVCRWVAPAENGAHISNYILECDDGTRSGKYSEIYRGRNKQYSIAKLQASTCYAIRLAACNEIGTSEWSEVLNVTTMGAAPPPPAPPVLQHATSSTLSVSWCKPTTDQYFSLQSSDPFSGHGFLNVYHGTDNEYTCCGLRRNTSYRFRLQAKNEDGVSRWSEEVSFCTAVETPAAPSRPSVKGRIHAHSFRLRWEPPNDTGGSPITEYCLELDAGEGFSPLWRGSETEFVCDRLKPGATYRARVSCSNSGGQSEFSDPCVVVTEPVVPGPCCAPQVVGKPRASSLQLKWDHPESDGGAMIAQFEVNMVNPDGSTRTAYVGRETECLVASLLPGRNYSFQVRASNRIGVGPWSDSLEALSGPGVPEPPAQLQLTGRSSHSISVAWSEPMNNGSTITEYRLEMAPSSKVKRSSSAGSLSLSTTASSVDDQMEDIDLDLLHFSQLPSCGLAKCQEVKSLHPLTTYYFRIQAVNSVGASGYSTVAAFTTLASSPAPVSGLRCVGASTTCLSISWNAPNSNGSPILHYNLEVGEKLSFSIAGSETCFEINGLSPDSLYRIRVQAVNAIGIGPFSSVAKCSTRPLPPSPPTLECVLAGHNHLKLRWGDGKNLNFIHYTLEMQEEDREEFYLVYEGTSLSYKVPKLDESTTYKFRICARNDVGEGPYSEVKEFTTTRAPPPTLKKPDVLDLNETSCRIGWSTFRLLVPSDRVAYQVEVIRTKDQEQIVMERCHESELFVNELEPHTEYSVRVCPVRLCEDGEIAGTYSPSKVFSTPYSQDVAPAVVSKSSSQQKEKLRNPLTDQQLIFIIIVAFNGFCVLLASALRLLDLV